MEGWPYSKEENEGIDFPFVIICLSSHVGLIFVRKQVMVSLCCQTLVPLVDLL